MQEINLNAIKGNKIKILAKLDIYLQRKLENQKQYQRHDMFLFLVENKIATKKLRNFYFRFVFSVGNKKNKENTHTICSTI